MDDKYNETMPETDDRVLCMKISKPITKEGYTENFLPRLIERVNQNDELRLLVYYEKYQGWEADAAALDFEALQRFGEYSGKIAQVNPPESVVLKMKMMSAIMKEDIRFFEEDEFNDALEWVQS